MKELLELTGTYWLKAGEYPGIGFYLFIFFFTLQYCIGFAIH